MKTLWRWSLCPIAALSLGCYSFTGASVPSHLKTIAIPLVEDRSGSGNPNVREDLTQALIRRFIEDNSLQIADRRAADAVLEGVILTVRDAPIVIESGESGEGQSTRNRMTVTVQMTFQDVKLRKKVWEKSFTNFGDFDPAGGFTAQQEGLSIAIRRLSEDILLDSVSGW